MSIFTAERQRRAEADLEAQRQAAKQTRDDALNAMTYTYADGAVVQVRPGDLPNFQTAIQLGGDHKWIMADNTVRLTSATELTEALNAGITQGKVIWDAYADVVSAIV